MEYKLKRIKTCEICREEANIICFNCANYYCDSCSKFIHEKKINQNHIKGNYVIGCPPSGLPYLLIQRTER